MVYLVDIFFVQSMREGKKFVRAPMTIKMSLAVGASVIGTRLSNICHIFCFIFNEPLTVYGPQEVVRHHLAMSSFTKAAVRIS